MAQNHPYNDKTFPATPPEYTLSASDPIVSGLAKLQTITLRQQRKFGAELDRIDLKHVTKQELVGIKALLALHGLLVFRNQVCGDDDLIKFGKMVGNGALEPSARRVSHGQAEKNVAYLTNLRKPDGSPLGFPGDTTDYWHSDQEFREFPASIGILFCLIPADSGGATSFATTAVENISIDIEELSRLRQLWSLRKPASSHDNAPQVTVSHPC